MRRILNTTLLLGIFAGMAAAQTSRPWTQLPLSACQVDALRKNYPTLDGRGVVVAVLDTGVDMGVLGLTKTPSGEVKVIDVQDFSGEGDVEIARALWNDARDRIVRYTSDGKQELYVPPPAEARPEGTTVWFGLLKEEFVKNSAVPDLNDNGRKDDVFGICIISTDNGSDDDAVCYVDTNADRDFSNDAPLKNYKLNYDTFTFPRPKKEQQDILLTFALNIFVRQHKVVFHFDDGGHGTHVAGIAAGCTIQGQESFNGVAPAAKIISLKVGHNNLAGGSTTTGSIQKAFEYAARYARENKVSVVCNLSYGIGSLREANSDIDKTLDKLLKANPGLVACVSAGNEGPGLSCVGTPGAAPSAITVAAILAPETARDVLGVQISQAQVTVFSSRGAELDKPDIATPGMVTSTVPRWTRGGDFWSGTSMSSPYAAGLCALLAQHVREKTGNLPRADLIKAALKGSAEPLTGFNAFDYGTGRPNILRAAELAVALATKYAADPLYAFEVSTESPMLAEGSGPTAYWRGTWFPTDRPQTFTIKPVFAPQSDEATLTNFSRRLMLRCNAEWCKLLQDQIYFRHDQPAMVRVQYDPNRIKDPGLYVATVEGVDGDFVPLRIVNSIIVPYRPGPENDYRTKIENQVVEGWKVRRYFINIPAGAGAMHITLRALEGQLSTAGLGHVLRPDGRFADMSSALRLDTRSGKVEALCTIDKDLEPGVWELPVTSAKADETSSFTLDIRFDGVVSDPAQIPNWASTPGSKPSGTIKLTNLFDQPLALNLTAMIEGYGKVETKTLKPDEDIATIPLNFTADIKAVRISAEVSDQDYVKFTDCALNIYNAAGDAIAKGGGNEPVMTIAANNPSPGAESASAKLEIRPAFANSNTDDSAKFTIRIEYLFSDPVNIKWERAKSTQLMLYPGLPTETTYNADRAPPAPPSGYSLVGYLQALDRNSKQVVIIQRAKP